MMFGYLAGCSYNTNTTTIAPIDIHRLSPSITFIPLNENKMDENYCLDNNHRDKDELPNHEFGKLSPPLWLMDRLHQPYRKFK